MYFVVFLKVPTRQRKRTVLCVSPSNFEVGSGGTAYKRWNEKQMDQIILSGKEDNMGTIAL